MPKSPQSLRETSCFWVTWMPHSWFYHGCSQHWFDICFQFFVFFIEFTFGMSMRRWFLVDINGTGPIASSLFFEAFRFGGLTAAFWPSVWNICHHTCRAESRRDQTDVLWCDWSRADFSDHDFFFFFFFFLYIVRGVNLLSARWEE